MVLVAGGCGGDLPVRYYEGHGGGVDGSACGGHGHSCGCVDEPYVLLVSLALAGDAGLTDMHVEFSPRQDVPATQGVAPPAKGSPGADGYFMALIESSDGVALSTLVFKDPRLAQGDAGQPWRAKTQFAMDLATGSTTLHIENWDTGQVLVDLDLRGHVQLLCLDRPCLSICQAAGGVDASSAPPAMDAGAGDHPSAVDSPAAEDAAGALTPGVLD